MSSSRIASLDGLRGSAALVVVFHHALLVNPTLDQHSLAPFERPNVGSGAWWMLNTPLHLFWAGSEAVMVFFVLSGLVLSLPQTDPTRRTSFSWVEYYPRRLARLYLPVWGALGFAVLLLGTSSRILPPEMALWVRSQSRGLTVGDVIRDATLLGSPGRTFNTLWSLEWEVVFSLVLPAVAVVARRTTSVRWTVLVPFLAGFVLLGTRFGVLFVVYLSVFLFGVALAWRADDVTDLCRRLTPAGWSAAVVVALILCLCKWLIVGLPVFDPLVRHVRAFRSMTTLMTVMGATMFVVVAWCCPLAQRQLSRPVTTWLGSRSFSLYLVHGPVVVAVARVERGWSPVAAVVAVAVSLVASEVFFRAIEQPSMGFARRYGSAFGGRRGRSVEAGSL